MKYLIIIVALFLSVSINAQKTATKKEIILTGNEYQVKQVAKSKEEITAKWIQTGKIIKLGNTAYDVYTTSSGKSYYIVIKTVDGWAKKKIN